MESFLNRFVLIYNVDIAVIYLEIIKNEISFAFKRISSDFEKNVKSVCFYL